MHKTREEWLQAASITISSMLEEKCGRSMPAVSVTVGWPSAGGLARKKQVIGQCWDGECSTDGSHAIFISPVLDAGGPAGALATLTHELIHALVGVEAKHKGPFSKACRQVGLTGKPTCTTAGEELLTFLDGLAVRLGEYPHAKLTPKIKEKVQTTRMIKMECGTCGYVARTTRKWLDEAGPVLCPCGDASGPMNVEGGDEPEEDAPDPIERDNAREAGWVEADACRQCNGSGNTPCAYPGENLPTCRLHDPTKPTLPPASEIVRLVREERVRVCRACFAEYLGTSDEGCSSACIARLALEDET